MAQLDNSCPTVFRAIAEYLNLCKAAQQLFLTQPAATLQMVTWECRYPIAPAEKLP
jgi:DNA-binding transcriptional LysR family regulator